MQENKHDKHDKEVIISEEGKVLCEDKNCQYKRECANHSSAGDHRTEGGFSPKLIFGDNKQIICLSSYVKSNNEQYNPSPIGHYDRGYANAIQRNLARLEPIGCNNCECEPDYSSFEIYFDNKDKKFYKKCINCRIIDEIKMK